jgi:hypothetical protein
MNWEGAFGGVISLLMLDFDLNMVNDFLVARASG